MLVLSFGFMGGFFSDRERGPRTRTEAELPEAAWRGIEAAIQRRVADGSFGYRYPMQCPDGSGPYGCDERSFWAALKANVPDLGPLLGTSTTPPTLAVLDAIEFCHEVAANPIPRDYHKYFSHVHFGFDPEEGRQDFRDEVNRILARNGLVYELRPDGQVIRLAPSPLREALTAATFASGDRVLDELLETARRKYLDPDLSVRREALEKLWDAWERIKTLEPGRDKKASAAALVDRASRSQKPLRDVLEQEALDITGIGNRFQIRHSEVGKALIERAEDVDYLFHRAFALVRLLLRATGRGG